MPEGDTIHKVAAYLDDALRDRRVQAVRLHPAFGPTVGARTVARVASEGKHLFISFEDGTALRSHLGMYGAWHSYPAGAVWRKPRRQASVVIDTAQRDFVCFNAKEVQWLRSHGFRRADQAARLGADLIRDGLAAEELLRRIDSFCDPQTLLVDLLLDQRIAAGIGNVYKSEVLFLEHWAPLRRVRDLGDDALLALYRRAAALLGENLGGGPRTTRFSAAGRGGLWVYGRAELPCRRCAAPVRRALLGRQPRSSYWCARCQA
ncbi:endonuclease VIII [Thiohalocapsa halophila]|uniref:DNA-(apurinic or apyrimidinic site) lyase n=1 Tax=Thiohalocapsa halophila TaxID=69359 RepID=A0ABS1CEQ4_9GAMM|nr:DNA-formamidopyrimidine glycosylase family protein [Thiohalocapsa halophila]MBK1629876.1 endonuclease VIII [Thiohalocapsa halophila]